jgi:hypothetical protein
MIRSKTIKLWWSDPDACYPGAGGSAHEIKAWSIIRSNGIIWADKDARKSTDQSV